MSQFRLLMFHCPVPRAVAPGVCGWVTLGDRRGIDVSGIPVYDGVGHRAGEILAGAAGWNARPGGQRVGGREARLWRPGRHRHGDGLGRLVDDA